MTKITVASLLIALTFSSINGFGQERKNDSIVSISTFEKGEKYTLGELSVSGVQQFSEQSVKVYSGLKTGQEINIPGDKLSSAIKKLYETKRFSAVDVYLNKIDGNTAYLEIQVSELPQLKNVSISGVSNSKAKTLKTEAELKKGEMLTDNLLVTTKNYFKKKYTDKGYLKTKVSLHTKKDSTEVNAEDLLIHIDKGSKIKIKEIRIHGNKKVSDKKIRKLLKNTKRKFWGRFWKSSKFIEDEFKEDLENSHRKL